ncbi:MAG: hypothetical protein R3E66_18020 [bacterium]
MSNLVKILLGIALLASFFGLSQTDPGIFIGFFPTWTNSTTGELYVWLAIPFLIFPAFALLADAFSQPISAIQDSLSHLVSTLAKYPRRVFVTAFGLALTGLGLGNHFILHGFPVTDDEWGARYGGQLLAMGKLAEAKPAYFKAMPELFLYEHGGKITSFDWLGAQIPWAIGELLHVPNLPFVALSAITVTAVAATVWHRLGPQWGVLAGVMFLASPMALSLSMTTHTHVVSRAFIACTLMVLDRYWDEFDGLTLPALAGVCGGLGWMARPIEVTMILGPLTLLFGYRAWQLRRWTGFATYLGVGAVFVGLFTGHSYAVTGTLLPARLAPNDMAPWTDHHKPPLAFLKSIPILKNRLGENISYNAFMLTIWVLGPLAFFFAWIGTGRNAFAKALAWGVVAALAVGLLHEDYGLHIVGPIHYSECVVPLILLVVFGVHRTHRWVLEHQISLLQWRTLVVALIASNIFFGAVHLDALKRQADIHQRVYRFFDDPKFDNSVILARTYADHWKSFPASAARGSFVFSWRRIDPRGSRVMIFHYTNRDPVTLKALKDAFPDRKFYELRTKRQAPYIQAVDFK